MTVVRRWLPLGWAVLAACGGPGVTLVPAPAADGAVASLFLIGDAGAAAPGDRVLAELARQGRGASRASAIVFLGDNVYPRGLPGAADSGFPEAARRLRAQAALADSTGLRVVMIPGNHDWARHTADGWSAIRRQAAFLDEYAAARRVAVELLPRGGCPGPAVTVAAGFRLVALDTQWWLHPGPKPGSAAEASLECPGVTERQVIDSMIGLGADGGARTVVVAHHPMESHGEHGGRHPWVQYVFPVVPTPVTWLPIGWIYPLGRRLIGHPQDLAGPANRRMRRAIEATFSALDPLVYASGHDHSLEVIRRGPRFYLVSGAGIESHQTAVGRGDSTAYASPRPGFMRLDRFSDGRVRLGVIELSASGAAESYSAWLATP